jgi:hypothetical protein
MTHHGHIGHIGHHGHHHGHHHRGNTNIIVTTPFVGYGLFSYFTPSYYTNGPGSVLGLIITVFIFLVFVGLIVGLSIYFSKKADKEDK